MIAALPARLALVALLTMPSGAKTEPKGTTYMSKHFSVDLPPGWDVIFTRQEPTQQLASDLPGAVAMRARAVDGSYMTVWFACPATEAYGDAFWDLHSDVAGRGVESIGANKWSYCTVEAKKACIAEAGQDEDRLEGCSYCGAGDGRFDAWATFNGESPFAGFKVCVQIGNTKREDVDQPFYRRVLSTLRIEGPTDLPVPQLPGWAEVSRVFAAIPDLPAALAAASKALPTAVWRVDESQTGDFTYDGIPDVALMGIDGATVHVVVVEGPISVHSRILAVRLTSGARSQDSLCGHSDDTHLQVEALAGGCTGKGKPEEPRECIDIAKRLPDALRVRGNRGLKLYKSDCDTFHVFFDGKSLTWWRL